MPETELVGHPQQRKEGGRADGAKYIRLIKRWGDGKLQRIAGLVPYPAVVARDHPKAVMPGSKVCVLRLAFVDHFLPVLILAFQLVFEMNHLWRDEAESGIVD